VSAPSIADKRRGFHTGATTFRCAAAPAALGNAEHALLLRDTVAAGPRFIRLHVARLP
jgi:hypothetical protein